MDTHELRMGDIIGVHMAQRFEAVIRQRKSIDFERPFELCTPRNIS